MYDNVLVRTTLGPDGKITVIDEDLTNAKPEKPEPVVFDEVVRA